MSKKTAHKDAYSVIFMGTGPFAIPILETIVAEPKWNLVATVTQPDQKVGRGNSKNRVLHKSTVKEYTLTHGATIMQPEKIDDAVIAEIKKLKPDIVIVASYGKILPQKLLAIPPHHAINVHASLLPKLRGASPIQNAIISGAEETGITLMHMDAGLDTGAIITQQRIAIDPHDTTPLLTKKLARLATEMLSQTLPQWLAGKTTTTPQKDEDATLCQLIEREDGHIVWNNDTRDIYNRYRALAQWPGIFGFWRKNDIDMLRVKFTEIAEAPTLSCDLEAYTPSMVFRHEKNIYVRTRDHAIKLVRVQLEGGKEMSLTAFINGNPTFIGTSLL